MTRLTLISWITLSCVVGYIANKNGRSFVGFLFLSIFFTPLVGILFAALAGPNLSKLEERGLKSGTKKKCPACAEVIQIEAKVCRFCGFNSF